MKPNKYYLAAFSAFFIWGFFSLALKPLHNYSSLDILFYRVFFSVTAMLVINLAFRKNVITKEYNRFKSMSAKQKRSIVFLTLTGGFFLSSNWFVFIYVMNHVSVKAASLAYLICPILTTILAFFLLKEQLSKWQWLAVSISVISCVLLSLNHFEDIFYSLVTAATYALYLISQRKNSEMDKFLVLSIQLVFTALVMLPFFPVYSGPVPMESLFYICLAFIVVCFTIVPLFLNLYALKGINSSAVGIMIYINPIIGFLLAIFYYEEEVTALQLFSYLLIIVSIVIFNERVLFKNKLNVTDSSIKSVD